MCVAKESMNNRIICVKLKWYCDDPIAQSSLLDMSETVCSADNWGTRDCCYAGDNAAGCDRTALLAVSI